MDIHKPKPWHDLGEFLKEYVIIVVGVLTALAAEQVVAVIHEHALRSDAREAIRGELGQNLDDFRRRDAVQECIDKRLLEVESLLVSVPLGGKLPRPLWIGRPQVWNVIDSRWAAATSGARTALLSPDEQAGYAEVYSGMHVFEEAERIEQLAWARLRSLETLPTLDVESRGRLVESLHEARYANFRIRVAGVHTREQAAAVGVKTRPSPYSEGSRSACVPMGTSREEAMKLITPDRTELAEP
jgi:hypothetical protein